MTRQYLKVQFYHLIDSFSCNYFQFKEIFLIHRKKMIWFLYCLTLGTRHRLRKEIGRRNY